MDSRNYVVDVAIRHVREDWQRDDFFIGPFGDGTRPRLGSKTFAIVGVQVYWNVVHLDANSFGLQAR